MPFGCGACDQLDLPFVESEALIGRARLRLDRPVVGEQDSLRAAFDDGGGNRTVGDIGEALRREYDRDLLLAQNLDPFADTGGESSEERRVGKECVSTGRSRWSQYH